MSKIALSFLNHNSQFSFSDIFIFSQDVCFNLSHVLYNLLWRLTAEVISFLSTASSICELKQINNQLTKKYLLLLIKRVGKCYFSNKWLPHLTIWLWWTTFRRYHMFCIPIWWMFSIFQLLLPLNTCSYFGKILIYVKGASDHVTLMNLVDISVTCFWIWGKVFKNGPSKVCGKQPLKIWRGMVYLKQTLLPSKCLKAVFHKFYLVHSWILCPICPSDLEMRIWGWK